MWPFNRKPSIPFAEFVKTLAPAPCGEQFTHYEWKIAMGVGCPVCSGIAARKKRDEDETRMADLIAASVVKRLKSDDARAALAAFDESLSRQSSEAAESPRSTRKTQGGES